MLGLFSLSLNNPDVFGYTLPPVNGSGSGTQAIAVVNEKIMSAVYQTIYTVPSVSRKVYSADVVLTVISSILRKLYSTKEQTIASICTKGSITTFKSSLIPATNH